MKISHIGYLVKNMDLATNSFIDLGYVFEKPIVYDMDRDVDICFMRNGDYIVEIIAPRPGCKLFKSLQKRIGNAPYHICYACDKLSEDIEKLKEKDYSVIEPPGKAIAIENKYVAFLFSSDIGLIELVESC